MEIVVTDRIASPYLRMPATVRTAEALSRPTLSISDHFGTDFREESHGHEGHARDASARMEFLGSQFLPYIYIMR